MKHTNTRFSIPEVLVASFILIWVILSSLQLTSSSILGMGKSKRRGLVDTAIASHIENLRREAFGYLCMQGCEDNELTKELRFELSTLKPACGNLGESFRGFLEESSKNPLESFTVSTTPPTKVEVEPFPDGNKLHIKYTAADLSLSINTTLVPHAQGWCP